MKSFRKSLCQLAAVVIISSVAMSSAYAGECETASNANDKLDELAEAQAKRIDRFTEREENFIDYALTDTATNEMIDRLNQYDKHIRDWLTEWWKDKFEPALKKQTKQLHLGKIDQSMQMGRLVDAQTMERYLADRKHREVEAQRRYRPSELTCQSDTAAIGQEKAYRASRAMSRAYQLEDQTHRNNAKTSDSGAGSGEAWHKIWTDYVAHYCDPARGDQGCGSTAGDLPGKNRSLPDLLWGDQQSIDMSSADNRMVARDAQRYLIGFEVHDPIPALVMDKDKSQGRSEWMYRRARNARINTVYNVLGQMLGERVGGTSGVDVKAIRGATGLDPSLASDNASYSELRETMARERYYDPKYITRLVGDPESVAREQGNVNALRLQLMNDEYKRLEERLYMETATIADDIDKSMPPDSLPSTPLR